MNKKARGRTLTLDGFCNLTYDYDNMPTSVTYESMDVDSVYDAGGQRIKKSTSSSTTIYIGQIYECTNGACTKHILAGTQLIASITGSETLFYHTDHLGSSSVITDDDGTGEEVVQEIYYYPYGEIKTNTTPPGENVNVRYKFTGKELDGETGLYYYRARYYDPKLARFISADTIVPLPFYPISLNRYAYAYNNPIRVIDLDGHYGEYYDYSSEGWWSSMESNDYEYYDYSYSYQSGYSDRSYVVQTYYYPAVNTSGYMGSAGTNMIGMVPGYPENNNNSWRSANDQVFISAVKNYNLKYGLTSGDPGYWTPERLKAQAMIESGGSKDAFMTDPLQMNKSTLDWVPEKSYLAGISKGEILSPNKSSAGALEWLRYKGYIHDSYGNEIEYRGLYESLRRYNGNPDIYSYHLGVQHRDWYASKILYLEFLMREGR